MAKGNPGVPRHQEPYSSRHYNRLARQVVEKALGHKIRESAPIHHIDGDRSNNKGSNLIACNDHQYHMILHQRARALESCGHATWRPCAFCKVYNDPELMLVHGSGYAHRDCLNKYAREHKGPAYLKNHKRRNGNGYN